VGGLQKIEALPDGPEPFGLVLIATGHGHRQHPAGHIGELVEILASADPLPLPGNPEPFALVLVPPGQRHRPRAPPAPSRLRRRAGRDPGPPRSRCSCWMTPAPDDPEALPVEILSSTSHPEALPADPEP